MPNFTGAVISIEEAREKGLFRFFTGEPCTYGHIAERYVSNPGCCLTCKRLGKQLKRAKQSAAGDYSEPSHEAKKRGPKPNPAMVETPGDERNAADRLYVSAQEQRLVLEAYAETHNFGLAAKAMGLTAAQLHARLGHSEAFRISVCALERSLDLKRGDAPRTVTTFEWTDEKRSALVEFYVDTGDISDARGMIGVTASQYYREVESNQAFAQLIEDAKPKADQIILEKAVSMSIDGNDKLLTVVLRTKFPEFREKLDVNVKNDLVRISDDQLNSRIARLLGKLGLGAIDVEFEPVRQIEAPSTAGGDAEAPVAEPIRESLPGDGAAAQGAISEASGVLQPGGDIQRASPVRWQPLWKNPGRMLRVDSPSDGPVPILVAGQEVL